ncbi:hypothetical protein SAMN05421548_1286 [Paraburkholderia lycopersici]|uniref:Uncharacterized protein n=1 Tax=Paraburkholderia lycopersici TaxID=416944 RepID=A0A1G6YJF7_9BURK|nr:hypothetical protein SAMN05421548_1286 [Paraburkholderia lycopersici]
MRAVVFRDIGGIRLDTVPDPSIRQPSDAIVQITSSAIRSRGGLVEEVGCNVRGMCCGSRVLIPSTISCGAC